MYFLLNLPTPLSFLVVSGVTVLIALSALHFVRRRYPPQVLKRNHEVAAIIFNAFGLLYAVILAFVVFVTWTGYDDATRNLQLEASQTIDIYYSAQVFPEPLRKTISDGLIQYARAVYTDELPRMAAGQINLHSRGSLRKLIDIFNGMDQNLVQNRVLYGESLRRLNALAEYRRLRIFAGVNTVPPVIWIVLLVGGVITVSYTYFFGMENGTAQYIMTAALTVTLTLILFLVYILDHPFTGTNKVSTEPVREMLEIVQGQPHPEAAR